MMLAIWAGGGAYAQPSKPAATVGDGPVLLGEPYAVGGVTYTPADPAYYDEVGFAGVADGSSRGDTTATGEAFVPSAISAAHKSLPLPSYVEVTALDSGRTILVRVNDRGPMRNDRLIALSPGAAEQLGVGGVDRFAVRVRRVNPPEQERAALRAHGRAAERLEAPPPLLKALRAKLDLAKQGDAPVLPPKPAPSKAVAAPKAKVPAPVKAVAPGRPGVDFDMAAAPTRPLPKPAALAPSASPAPTTAGTGGFVVQIGAFSSQSRAEAVAKANGAQARQAGGYWRVRMGPYATRQAAAKAAAAKGFENGQIMANDAR